MARAAFSRGNPSLRMHDEPGVFYQDQAFAALCPVRGRPLEPHSFLCSPRLTDAPHFAADCSAYEGEDELRTGF
jgi:hypothetical protein